MVGVDFSQPMIDLAIKRAEAAGLASKCQFVAGDFRLLQFPERFDCAIAIGVFDYLKEPRVFLERMRKVTARKIVATFPCRWSYRVPLRKVRLGLQGCPVYFYSDADVEQLFLSLDVSSLTVRRMGHIFFAVAELPTRDQ